MTPADDVNKHARQRLQMSKIIQSENVFDEKANHSAYSNPGTQLETRTKNVALFRRLYLLVKAGCTQASFDLRI